MQTLIEVLSQRGPYAVSQAEKRPYEIFRTRPREETFHCASFFRTHQVGEKYDVQADLSFSDGRTYKVTSFGFLSGYCPDVETRCCIDVIEAQSGEFVPLEIWFYQSAFLDGRFVRGQWMPMVVHSRWQAWDFLFYQRAAVDWSRYGLPYVIECR